MVSCIIRPQQVKTLGAQGLEFIGVDEQYSELIYSVVPLGGAVLREGTRMALNSTMVRNVQVIAAKSGEQAIKQIRLFGAKIRQRVTLNGHQVGANGTRGQTVGNLEPGNPASTSIVRNGDRLVLNQGQLPTCGPNSCAMVMDTAGLKYDLGTLITQSGITEKGTTLGRLSNTLNKNGLSAQRVTGVTMESLSEATAKGNPAIVRMSLDRGGHAIVVDGITVRNGQSVVAIRDPALGRQYFTPVNEFKQKFSGEAIFTNGAKK